MVIGQRVLLVDGLSETEQVLKAVLEPRGLQVDRVRGHASPSRTATTARPNVVVLHEESLDGPRSARWDDVPRVIIGSIPATQESTRDAQFLPHPFQYRELIQAIDSLLKAKPEESAA